jgi:REP element-mobilizing transposase RayT
VLYPGEEQVARTASFAVRVFSVAVITTVPYSIAVSKLRRPFLSDRYFFIVRLLRRREKFTEPDFALLARAFNRAWALHPFDLTAWVFLPDHWHCIGAPVYPVTISLAMKSVKQSSMGAVNQRRGADGELWQPRFFDRALRSVKEYNQKVAYIHLNPVRAGLLSRPEDWRWSSYNEYAGLSADEQNERCGLIVDRVRMPSDPRARICSLHQGSEKTRTTKAVVRATRFV